MAPPTLPRARSSRGCVCRARGRARQPTRWCPPARPLTGSVRTVQGASGGTTHPATRAVARGCSFDPSHPLGPSRTCRVRGRARQSLHSASRAVVAWLCLCRVRGCARQSLHLASRAVARGCAFVACAVVRGSHSTQPRVWSRVAVPLSRARSCAAVTPLSLARGRRVAVPLSRARSCAAVTPFVPICSAPHGFCPDGAGR